MICPLCGLRKARRSCPALDRQICAVCCGTKRLSEIRCTPDCGYLTSAREHPAAAVVRQRQRDLALAVRQLRDLSERQAQLFVAISTFIGRHPASDLQPLLDEDLADAATALASTFETASRGVIYEHRPASLPAQRLASVLMPVLAEAGGAGGSAFERDAAVVLRRIVEGATEIAGSEPGNRRAYLEFVGRLVARGSDSAALPGEAPRSGLPGEGPRSDNHVPRLIVP